MITGDDLRWWLGVAPSLTWIFAKTYAQTAPHEYVVLGRNGCPLSRDDFVRAAKVIATFGAPAKFYSMTQIYLTSPDGRVKWWTMDRDLDATDLINQADTERAYGPQDAPSTSTPGWTDFDGIATDYDCQRAGGHDEQVRAIVAEHFADRSPRTLDVGCGTGALLDLGVLDLRQYTGIDPSQAMLNMLVRKHPDVGRLIPARFEDVKDLVRDYELVTAIDVPVIDVGRLRDLSTDLVILTTGSDIMVLPGAATRGS